MRYLVVLLLLTISSLSSASDDEKKKIFIDFEAAYMSNNAEKYSKWLSQDYVIKQIMHIPGVGPHSIPVTKEQIIQNMRKSSKPNTLPRSNISEVTIVIKSESSFCGTSETHRKLKVRGVPHKEKEVRKVCFKNNGSQYLAVEHYINVHFTKI